MYNPFAITDSERLRAGMGLRTTRDMTAGIKPVQISNPVTPPSVNWGGIAQGAIGAAGILGTSIGMAQQDLDVDTNTPALQTSATGEPVYNGRFYTQAQAGRPQGATFGETLGTTAQGATAGFMAGGVPGAIIGAGAGLLGGLIGGRRRRKRQEEQKRQAIKAANVMQKQYNIAAQGYEQQQDAMASYRQRRDKTNRLHNLYTIANTYY